MSLLEINLLRARVPGARQRRNTYLAFLAYLAFSGIFLVWVANLCAHRLVDADYHRLDWLRILRGHAQTQPGDLDPDATLTRLQREVQAAGDHLSVVEQVLQQRVRLAPLLLGLRHPLPSGMRMVDVSYNQADHLIQFGVATPEAAPDGERMSSADLTARWTADATLSASLRDIKPVRTERTNMKDQPVLVERYSATVSKGGTDHGSRPLLP